MRKKIYILGILFNLFLLGFFKYFGFLVFNINFIFKYQLNLPDILLPLAISFFTFQQIAYITDCYTGKIKKHSALDYVLFITFFPQLIAGPIIRYNEFLPWVKTLEKYKIDYQNTSIGLNLFFIGLFKSAVIANTFGIWADQGFSNITALSCIDAWITSLSYTFQLYFDFSGYIDMATGSARFFNIQLPINFDSPYCSRNIQEFWRRWHITLGRFLKDYIYIPLGGNKNGIIKTYLNILITFLLCGLWHGAGWTFIIWGALHGIGTVVHRIWKKLDISIPGFFAGFITFNFINIAWVFFRAETFNKAILILKSMGTLTDFGKFTIFHSIPITDILVAVCSIMAVFIAGNTNHLPAKFVPSQKNIILTICLILIGFLYLNSSIPKEFIYFDF